MNPVEYSFEYEIYDSVEDLAPEDADLLRQAREITRDAYAPYSHFRVGATAKMKNGRILSGTNQENASFPAGLCAEGVVLAMAGALFPGMPIDTLAVSFLNEQGSSSQPISPCGICRQSLQEFEMRTGQPVRLILGGQEGKIYLIPRAGMLLPLAFSL